MSAMGRPVPSYGGLLRRDFGPFRPSCASFGLSSALAARQDAWLRDDPGSMGVRSGPMSLADTDNVDLVGLWLAATSLDYRPTARWSLVLPGRRGDLIHRSKKNSQGPPSLSAQRIPSLRWCRVGRACEDNRTHSRLDQGALATNQAW